MKKPKAFLIICLILLTITGLLSWTDYEKVAAPAFAKPTSYPISMCGSVLADWNDTTATGAKILPGLGDHRYRITTVSPNAQEFFDQGLRLVYAFNHWEAIQAFREAVALDPDCAMGYWGLALAYGPNLNDVNPTDRERIAHESIQKALARTRNVTAAEQGLINAMAARYNGRSYPVRDSLNRTYADAMLKLSKSFPQDAEVQTLCADAIMNTMPWDYWLKDGSPKAETQQAKVILENVLKKFPGHPGAHHLYIHLVEASPNPDQALSSAKFLETAMPGAGHLVHMPAHIYLRVGDYTRSLESNVQAVKADEDYLSNSNNRGMYRLMYYPHNVDFISYSSLMTGRSNLGIQTAMKLAYKGGLITTSNPVFAQYFSIEPMLAFTRFGKWNDILSLPDPDDDQLYIRLIWRFTRGMAQLRSNNLAQAEKEFLQLDSLSKMDTLNAVYFSFNPAAKIAKVPQQLLQGELLIKQKKVSEGIALLEKAVQAEDDLSYMEPPDWKIPARQFLGAALLENGKFAEAEKVYLDDLKNNPENGWSLKGLMLAQDKLGKKVEAAATAKRFEKAWKDADITISSSRF